MEEPRFVILFAIRKYLSDDEYLGLKNDLGNADRLSDVKFMNIISKYFDWKRLIFKPIDPRDAWIYNYLFYECKMQPDTKMHSIGEELVFIGKLLKKGLIKQYYHQVYKTSQSSVSDKNHSLKPKTEKEKVFVQKDLYDTLEKDVPSVKEDDVTPVIEKIVYPLVLFPDINTPIIQPVIGRMGYKGHLEQKFKLELEKHFNKPVHIYTDVSLERKWFPDITLVCEREGECIIVDIEIDEPYEGIDDVQKRRPIHYRGANNLRDCEFLAAGWIIIRFAEIQVRRSVEACCVFVAKALSAVYPMYEIPKSLTDILHPEEIEQWTYEEAYIMSLNNERERYLGIERFGIQRSIELQEDSVIKEAIASGRVKNILQVAIERKLLVSFIFREKCMKVYQPHFITGEIVTGYCRTENRPIQFYIPALSQVRVFKDVGVYFQ